MNRLSSYLTGLILGSILMASFILGHENQWLSAGPLCGMIFGILAGLGLIAVTAVMDEDH